MAKKEANIIVRLRDRASSGFKKLGGAIGSVLKPIGLVTGALTGLVSLAGGAFLVSAIRTTGTFGEQMSILRGLTQASREELQAMEEAARSAGASTRFSATEAGQGLEELSRGGQSVKESIQTLNPVLDLAAGNNQSVAESAQQVVTALNQFGLAAGDSSRVADVLTRAAQRSAQTVAELNEAMIPSAPIAKQAGLSIEQTAGLIGRLADQGFRGSLGGTALRNALIDLQAPSSNFRKELDRLGIRSTNFVEVLAELEKRGGEADTALQALGKRSGPAITALVSSGSEDLRQLIEQLQGASGAAGEAATAMEDNLPGAFRNLKSAFQDLQIELSAPLTERIKEEVFSLADTIRNFTQSETVASLRQVLVDVFDSGKEAVKGFLNAFDLETARQKVDDLLSSTRDFFTDLVESGKKGVGVARDISAAFDLAGATIRGTWSGLGEIITRTAKVGVDAVNFIVIAAREASLGLLDMQGRLTGVIDGLREKSGKLSESADEYRDRTRSAVGDAANALGRLRGSYDAVGESADRSAEATRRQAQEEAAAEEQKRRINQALEEEAAANELLEEAVENAAEAVRLATEGTEEYDEKSRGAAQSVDQLREQAEQAKSPFDQLKEAIGQASSLGELNGLVQQMATLADQGEITDEQYAQLRDTIIQQSEALDRSSAAAGGNERALKDSGRAARDTSDEIQRSAETSDEAAEATRRHGFQVELSADAQRVFNKRLQDMQALTPQKFAKDYAAALEEAVEMTESAAAAEDLARRRREAAQHQAESYANTLARLRREHDLLGFSAVQSLEDIAQANRELQHEILRTEGRERELAELRDQERRKDLELQIRAAMEENDREREFALREQLKLLDELNQKKKEQARQEEEDARRRERERRTEQDADRSTSRGGGVSRPSEPQRIVLEAGLGRDGQRQLTQADVQAVADRVMQMIDNDRRRT
ncbi:MAG: phage tail tape measure protein [Wenzhouxiangella sp.]